MAVVCQHLAEATADFKRLTLSERTVLTKWFYLHYFQAMLVRGKDSRSACSIAKPRGYLNTSSFA